MLDRKNVFSMGRKALDKAANARALKDARWTAKNMPAYLTDEQKKLLGK